MLDKIIKVLLIISWVIGLWFVLNIIAFFWRLETRYKVINIPLDTKGEEE